MLLGVFEDQKLVVEYGKEVLKSLAPTGRMISNLELSPPAFETYSEKHAEHHMPEIDALEEDVSKGHIVTDHKKWKPIQLLLVVLQDFASRSSRQQCEELKRELDGVLLGEVSSNIRYFTDTFFLPEIAPIGV